MPVPAFTESGLLPSGVHGCSFIEAEEVLCSNERRSQIWAGLVDFVEWTQPLPQADAMLIDGSYVTDKPLPSDVDIVVDVTSCSAEEQRLWFEAWGNHHEHVKATFSVDFYPFSVGHGNDFSAFFQYVRVEEALRRGIPPHVRKGILRVQL